MSDKSKLHHALLDRIKEQAERVNREMDSLLTAINAIPPAERVGADWGRPEGIFSKRYIELHNELAEIGRKHQLAILAIEQPDIP